MKTILNCTSRFWKFYIEKIKVLNHALHMEIILLMLLKNLIMKKIFDPKYKY